MTDEFDHRYRALLAKDPRFDGWFFIAVTSTGVYCRPSCPAMTPQRDHVRFYPSAAACQQAGFRACKRCRPDASPGSPEWNTRGDVAARAMRLIADGAIDRDGVPGLASRLGYSARQLERVLRAEVGAGPLALARAQRAQTARILIETTSLAMAEVAMAAGFRSIRQFNETVRAVFALTPTELRRRAARAVDPAGATAVSSLPLRLAFRRPLAPQNLFGHLAATAVPGVEEVRDGVYRRTLRLPHGAGIVALTPQPDWVDCRLRLADLRDLAAAIARCRRLLDLDADPEAIDQQLGEDHSLRPAIGRAPGRRVPRTVDGAEMAIRAVLGQQISTAAARTHAARLALSHGEPVTDPDGGLSRLFPAAETLVGAHVAVPAARRRTLDGLLGALVSGELDLGASGDRERTLHVLGRASRDRALDHRRHFDACARRSGCLPGRRPRRAPGSRRNRATDGAIGTERMGGAVAAVARIRRAVPVGGHHASDQRLAAGGTKTVRTGWMAPRTPSAARPQYTGRRLTGPGS